MGTKLLVTNLPLSVDSSALEDMFTLIGNVRTARVELDEASGTSRGVGHVEMMTAQEAQDGISHFNGQSKGGQRLAVREDKPHVPKLKARGKSV